MNKHIASCHLLVANLEEAEAHSRKILANSKTLVVTIRTEIFLGSSLVMGTLELVAYGQNISR